MPPRPCGSAASGARLGTVVQALRVTAKTPSRKEFQELLKTASTKDSSIWSIWDSSEYAGQEDGKAAVRAYGKEASWKRQRSRELFEQKCKAQLEALPTPFLYQYNYADKEEAIVSIHLLVYTYTLHPVPYTLHPKP